MASAEAILISCPILDLDGFINKVSASTGHIITSGIDGSGFSLKSHPKFLALLGELKSGKTTHPNESMKMSNVSSHLVFSFLIMSSGPMILKLVEFGIVTLTVKAKTGVLAVATGTLKQWLDVVDAGIMVDQIRPQFNHLGITQDQLLN